MTTQYDLTTAARFAALAHDGQTRKGSTDAAFIHPRRVAALLRVFYPDALDLQAAAYLHDTVEDTDVTVDEVRDWFGVDVAYLVDAVTNDDAVGFRHSIDPRVLRLKVADLYDNMGETYRAVLAGQDIWREFKAGPAKVQRWRYHLNHVLRIIGTEDLPQRADELLRRIEAIAPKPEPKVNRGPAPRKSQAEAFVERYGNPGPSYLGSIWDDIEGHLSKGRNQ